MFNLSLISGNWKWLTFLYPELAKSGRSYKIRRAMISDKLALVAKQHWGRTIIVFAASCCRHHNLFMFCSFCVTVGSLFIRNVFFFNGNGAIPEPWRKSRDERLLSPFPVGAIIWYLVWNERMLETRNYLSPVRGGGKDFEGITWFSGGTEGDQKTDKRSLVSTIYYSLWSTRFFTLPFRSYNL